MGSSAAKQTVKRIALKVAIVAVLGLLPTCVTMSVLPVGTRLAAPLVCPSDTAHSVVMSRWGGNSKGGSSLKYDLYCLTAEGHGTVPSTPKIVFALVGLWGAVIALVLLLLRARRWIAARRSEGRGNA